jgi:hypothetical protein
LVVTFGGSIAEVYSRLPLLRDYDFASNRTARAIQATLYEFARDTLASAQVAITGKFS